MNTNNPKRADYWIRTDPTTVTCTLCPHQCRIKEGRTGLCRVRTNHQGELKALTYGLVSSIAVDPIEKKPLYHFYPGQFILSIGSVGCNLRCLFCQNWQISQVSPETVRLAEMDSERVVEETIQSGSLGVAYTYNEPFIWWEFVRDTALLARDHQLKNVLVTNGFVETEPLRALLPLIDAMNVDLKAMDEGFYREYCHGQLEPVLNTITSAREAGIHLEITNLLIPDLNDHDELIERLVNWLYELDPNIPLHLSRYFPHYRCQKPPTPVHTLNHAWAIAHRKLPFVYLGNIQSSELSCTNCPNCGKPAVVRDGYRIRSIDLTDQFCIGCGYPIPIINE